MITFSPFKVFLLLYIKTQISIEISLNTLYRQTDAPPLNALHNLRKNDYTLPYSDRRTLWVFDKTI